MDPIKIILVDDHKIVRDGIKSMAIGNKSVNIIGEAADADSLFSLLTVIKPDLILLDIALPGMSGIEITKTLSSRYPYIKVLALSAIVEEETIIEIMKAGADGFLSKNISKQELFSAIDSVMNNELYFCDIFTELSKKGFLIQLKDEQNNNNLKEKVLSRRELQILKMLAEGLSYKSVADALVISPRTVETHKNNILVKLKLNNTIELTRYAIKNKIIEI